MLTLKPAFADSDRAQLVKRVQQEEPTWPRKLDPLIPRDLETIVLKAMAKEPDRRYATATAMAEDLRRFLSDRPVGARRVARWERVWRWVRRNPGLAVSTASAAVLLLVIALGSVATAARLGTELRRRTDAQRAEHDAKQDALEKLWRSHLARAQAGRFSRRPGQRLDGLAALDEATRIARKIGISRENIDELRNEAIACLALPDLRPGTTSVAIPPGTSAIAFDDDYGHYAVSNAKGTISVYRFGDDRPVISFPGLGRALETLLFSPDGRYVAGFSSDKLQVWILNGGKAVFPVPLPARSLNCYNADSSRLVSVRFSRRLDRRVGPADRARKAGFLRTGIVPTLFAAHPDGRQLAVGYGDHAAVVEIWDIESGKKVTELAVGETGSVCALAWHPEGRQLALAFDGPTGRVQICNIAERRAAATLEGHAQRVHEMAFHPRGGLLMTGSWDGTSRLWDAETGRQLVNWPAGIRNVHFSPDGGVCGFAIIGGRGRLMEVADGREYRTIVSSLGVDRGAYHQGALSADGLLVVGMDDGARLWDLDTGREVAFLQAGQTVSVSFVSRPDGRELLTCGTSALRRWPIVEDPEQPGLLRIDRPRLISLPFTPLRADVRADGRAAVVASENSGTAVVLELPTFAVRCTLEAPHESLNRAALSPDGRCGRMSTSGWHTAAVVKKSGTRTPASWSKSCRWAS